MGNSLSLKLLVVGLSWPLETFLRRLLVGLAGSGIEVLVASPERPDGIPVQWIQAQSWRGSAASRLLWSAVSTGLAWARSPAEARLVLGGGGGGPANRQVRALHDLAPLVGRDWDVLYFPWNSAAAAHLPLFKLGKPVVVSCRGSQMNIAPHDPRRRAEVGRYFEALELAAFVHCVSDALKRVVEGEGIGGEKVRVIRPAVDSDFFSPERLTVTPNDPVRLVTTGSLIWKKGYENLLLALGSLRASGVTARLRVIGDGPERQRVLYTISDLGLGDSVDLLGRLDETQVRDELRRSDLFVLASLSEGISNAALEGMSCGLPVVSTNVGGMAEVIRDGVEGRLVPPRDPEAMAEVIYQLSGDRELRLRMGAAARDRVVRQFDSDKHIAAWRELLGSAMDKHRARVSS